MTSYPPELEQAVAERLAKSYWNGEGVDASTMEPLRPNLIGHGWLAVAREALAIRDEAMMEAARKVRDYLTWPWNRTDDTALRKIIGLELVKAERSRTFEQTRERCAKVLDDEATRLDDKPIGVPTIVYSYAADRCRWLAARIRALPLTEEEK